MADLKEKAVDYLIHTASEQSFMPEEKLFKLLSDSSIEESIRKFGPRGQ